MEFVDRFQYDFSFAVIEIDQAGVVRAARFRLNDGFAAEPQGARRLPEGIIHSESTFVVSAAGLEHGTSCLAFALQERAHVNL